MKIKNIAVEIKSLGAGLEEFSKVVSDAQRGRFPKKPVAGVAFVSLEAMLSVLTPRRMELLRLIRELEPDSIYELSKAAKRDLKNVRDDVALLARVELVSLGRPKTRRKRVVPRVDYDRLQVQIPMI